MTARNFRLPLAACLLASALAASRAEEPDFWKAQQAVRRQVETRDIGSLASAPASEGDRLDPQQAMQRFILLFLAGHDEEAAAFLPVLQAQGEQLGVPNLSRMADELIRRERWDLARRYLEALPQSEPGWGYVFLNKWSEAVAQEEADRWLAERAAASPGFWSRERFRLAARQKRQEALVEVYRERLEANPGDAAAALELAHGYQQEAGSPGIGWLADLYQPAGPSAAFAAARALQEAGEPVSALKLLEKARDLPFGPADQAYMEKLASQRQAMRPGPVDHEKDFRGMVRQEMARLFQETGNSAEAQKLLERIAADFPDGLPAGMMGMAGRIQADSGAPVIENRLLEAGKKAENEGSWEYWRNRADYYQGRQEWEQALEACRKALALCPQPQTDTDGMGKAGSLGQNRYWTICHLARCLQALKRDGEAFEALRQELGQWPPNLQLSGYLAYQMALDFNPGKRHIKPDDETLWTWLAARQDWSTGADRLLRAMAEYPGPLRDAFWERAQQLALGDPRRAAILGSLLLDCNEPRRALACLEKARQGLPAGEERENAACSLFGLYRQGNDWKQAGAILPEAAGRYTYEEYVERWDELAEMAAKTGHGKEALEFWTQARNRDRWTSQSLDNLVRAGLKKELIAYYQDLVRKEPACTAAKADLQKLQGGS
jgi:tetratricopeptide (TPR) repeat protein